MSQRELARRASVAPSMVSAYERDLRQPTLPTLIRLLRASGFEPRIRLEPLNPADDPDPRREPPDKGFDAQIDLWRSATSLP